MKKKILIIITFLAGTLMFNSCLKDKLNSDWTSSLAGKMYAEIPNNGKQSNTITPDPTDQDIKFLVNIATDALPTSDITMTLAIDPAALSAYNAANLAAYLVANNNDSTGFIRFKIYPTMTIVNPSVVIKAGTRNNYVHVTLKSANLLNLSTSWMVPISITAVTGGVTITANKKTVLIATPIANKWEGKYKMVTGSTFSDLSFPAYTINFPANFALETAGPYTVNVKDLSAGLPTQYAREFNAAGTGSYYGTWCPVFQIDPVTNKVTSVVNYYINPANGRTGLIDPAGVNTYNPVTKTFDVSYFVLQPVPAIRLKFHDILTWSSPL